MLLGTYMHDTDVVRGLLQCYERHNKPDDNGVLHGSQRCGMLIKAVMEGAKDTPTCIRRSNMIMNLSPRNLLYMNYICTMSQKHAVSPLTIT